MLDKETLERLAELRKELAAKERANQKDITYAQTLGYYAKDVERECKKKVAERIIVDAKVDYEHDWITVDMIEGDEVIFHFRWEALSELVLNTIPPRAFAATVISDFRGYILRSYFRNEAQTEETPWG